MDRQVFSVAPKSQATQITKLADNIDFRPRGFLQRLAVRFLQWTRCMHRVSVERADFNLLTIEPGEIFAKLNLTATELDAFYGGRIDTVLVGPREANLTFAEAAKFPGSLTFKHQAEMRRGGCHKVIGLNLVIVPWMRGILPIDSSKIIGREIEVRDTRPKAASLPLDIHAKVAREFNNVLDETNQKGNE